MILTPRKAWRKWPLNTVVLSVIGVLMVWYGETLLRTSGKPWVTQTVYQGPLSLWSLKVWGIAFVVCGFIEVLRILMLDSVRISLAMHLPVMMLPVGYAVAFDVAPNAGFQPLLTGFALFVAWSPFIAPTVIWVAKKRGYAFVATPIAKYPVSDYSFTDKGNPLVELAFQAGKLANDLAIQAGQLSNDKPRLPSHSLDGSDRRSLPSDLP